MLLEFSDKLEVDICILDEKEDTYPIRLFHVVKFYHHKS